jgi:release factor glutamine methyltransferase
VREPSWHATIVIVPNHAVPMPATLSSQTISDALHTATVMLERSSGSPRLDAELLLEHVTGLTRASFRASPERELPTAAGWSFQQLVKRRMQGEPIAYIRGHQEFWSLLFEVNSDVLIPRPETELLVERALEHLGDQQASSVVDLGTGSGAVGLSIAHERPTIVMHATDVSPRALDVAARNAARLNIRNVKFAQADWFAGLADALFDLIVSNPPYIAENDPDLHPQVRKHEPIGALIPGRTGLEAIEHIIANAGGYLVSGGWLALEHGWQQAPAVRNLLVRHGFTHVRSHADLSGHERVTEGQKRSAVSG